MSRKIFTEEEMLKLRQNPYVYRVTPSRLTLTKEFKEIFYSEYMKGTHPRKILEEHGFDIDVIGEGRMWSICKHVCEEHEQYGEFHEGRRPRRASGQASKGSPLTEKEQMKQLQDKVAYMEQELEFLKKIFALRNTRK